MIQNLRDEVAMDVDDEDGTQQPKKVNDYGVEVDFESLDQEEREVRTCVPTIALFTDNLQDASAETGAQFDTSIAKINTEIERMAPNMKAMER